MKYIFFVDFDGTITTKDTCAVMVEAFASEGWKEINEQWENKIISTQECANRTFQLFDATLDDIKKLLDNIEIDKDFKDFFNFCKNKGYPIYILSDGYDFIIEYVLKKHEINLPYYANKMIYEKGFSIVCTYSNQSCGICGTCKKNLMELLREPENKTVYVGDGTSDLCPVGFADIVFAKGKLLQYCRENGIKAESINGFADILKRVYCFAAE